MKKVLIIPSNTDLNRGDQALIWESAHLAESLFKDEPIEVFLMDSDNEDQVCQTKELGYKLISPILKHPSRIYDNHKVGYDLLTLLLWGGCALYDYLRTRLLITKFECVNKFAMCLFNREERKSIKLFKECDAVFVKGGGFLHSYGKITDPYQFYYYLFDYKLATHYKKPVVLLPNSIGPLKNKIAKRMLEKTLNKCSLVYTRESVSQEYLDSTTVIKARQSLDLAFYQTSDKKDYVGYLKNNGVDINNKNIAITLRPYRFPESENSKEHYNAYCQSIRGFIIFAREMGFYVTMVTHTLGPSAHENDCDAIEDVLSICKDIDGITYINDKSLTCRELQKVYSYFDCVVGTRFHSVIFALNSLVPTVAITYGGNKGKGIMKDLGLSEYSLPIEEVSAEKLDAMFSSLMDNKNKFKQKVNDLLQKATDERNLVLSELQKALNV